MVGFTPEKEVYLNWHFGLGAPNDILVNGDWDGNGKTK